MLRQLEARYYAKQNEKVRKEMSKERQLEAKRIKIDKNLKSLCDFRKAIKNTKSLIELTKLLHDSDFQYFKVPNNVSKLNCNEDFGKIKSRVINIVNNNIAKEMARYCNLN